MPHQIALNKTKIALMSRPDSTFFTTVCFSLKHIWDDTVPTACTNGLEIRFNPRFFMELGQEERVFLLLHETLHVALLHMARLNDHKPGKWNIAADHVINLMLLARGFKMPKNGYADEQYAGMSTEEVYKALPDDADMPTETMDIQLPPLNQEELEATVQDILIRASVQSRMSGDAPGTIPGEIEIYLDKLLKPRLPWFRILQKYLTSLAKNDYSFKVPNRRFFPKYHLPSLHSERLMDIAIAVDASGSVSDANFKVFISEVDGILRMMNPEKITLIQFDTTIRSVDTVKNVRELSKLIFTGRGGTNISPVMKWTQENKPQLLLLFSDGYFKWKPEHTTKIPTLWMIHNNGKFTAPFGKVVHYKI